MKAVIYNNYTEDSNSDIYSKELYVNDEFMCSINLDSEPNDYIQGFLDGLSRGLDENIKISEVDHEYYEE